MKKTRRVARTARMAVLGSMLVLAASGCRRTPAETPHQTFATPEAAVAALSEAVKAERLDRVSAIFGPGSQALIDSSDPATGRLHRQVFIVAMGEGWHLESPNPSTRTLVIGHEDWPFPIPIVKDTDGWRFDAGAGVEEILARRIGRNELTVIRICETYVTAQHVYARSGHDGRPAGLYAAAFRSTPGREDGLYWEPRSGEKLSPLGDLVAGAAAEGRPIAAGTQPMPFHGYYFRILTAQGAAAPGGPRSYLSGGALANGFALVAWPAKYDVTGVMTFIVNQDGVVREKDLGADTDAAARALTAYDPDASWTVVP